MAAFLWGVGKFLSAGTDVGLGPDALELLSTLVDRSIHEKLAGALRFVSVDRPELAVGCAVTTLLRTHDGDLVFFLAADHASAEAMRDALRALWSASHTRAVPRDHPGFG